jgi:isoquinoline 1-oxidoreductase subunit beta
MAPARDFWELARKQSLDLRTFNRIAQSPMEPPTATARVSNDACEVWCSVQAPEAIRTDLAKRFNLPVDKITVYPLLLGGGFGCKSKPDFASEAAILSRAIGGRPVKLTFTREDDIQHSFFHTAAVERLEAGVDAAGKPIAWLHPPTIQSIFAPDPKHEGPFELAMGAVDMPFAIPNVRVENPETEAHTRIGWFRSVSNIPHVFAVQSFMGELAAALGRDPKDYLLELIGPDRLIDPASMSDGWVYGEDPKLYPFDTGRLRRVSSKRGRLGTQADSGPRPWHRGASQLCQLYGGCRRGSGRHQRQTVNPSGRHCFDCGAVVNPDRVRAQLEGAVIQGVSLATLGENQLQGRAGRADQFRQLRGDAYRCSADADPHASAQSDRLRSRSVVLASPACHPSRLP